MWNVKRRFRTATKLSRYPWQLVYPIKWPLDPLNRVSLRRDKKSERKRGIMRYFLTFALRMLSHWEQRTNHEGKGPERGYKEVMNFCNSSFKALVVVTVIDSRFHVV
ncbi:hypothetical protein KQX54_003763 [Cotesia glomerata]|uniref:Uncharacterized protein n=1 Tax=Cotesia glomerata TaxID=32391 RepID=A0AAV7J2D2_COTGL|nr:hypothetical protein KQX54_003763 [Cotesia glomerata]